MPRPLADASEMDLATEELWQQAPTQQRHLNSSATQKHVCYPRIACDHHNVISDASY
jgi:hypothetical protein